MMLSEAEKFLGLQPAVPTPPPEIPLRWRLILYFGAWLVVLIILSPDPRGVVFLPFFPAGLMVWVMKILPVNLDKYSTAFFVSLWLGYIVHGIATVSQGKKFRFFILFGILIIVLACNAVGCGMVIKGLSNIT